MLFKIRKLKRLHRKLNDTVNKKKRVKNIDRLDEMMNEI